MPTFHATRRATLIAFLALIVAAESSCAVVDRWDVKPRPQGPLTLRWVPDPNAPGQAWVEAGGIDADALVLDAPLNQRPGAGYRVLYVHAVPTSASPAGAADALPPMVGDYDRASDGGLRFRPQFPLEPGVRYEAVLDLRATSEKRRMLDGVLTATYTPPPRPEAPPAVVSRVYPSADELPENLLKFYVHFSAPMSRGGVYRHVRLIDDQGAEVELPFLELDEELWDPEMTRLTLFIDPGRIKRGVRPLEEIGPALVEGKHYTLVIDRGLVDASGRALGEEFRKAFAVGPPDREAPEPAKWKVTPPYHGTRDPLTIQFPEPMDHALAERMVRVTAKEQVVPGEVSLGDNERAWTFTPAAPWAAGRYDIVVQPTIEDLTGNNIGKPFEVEIPSDGASAPELKPARLPFDVR